MKIKFLFVLLFHAFIINSYASDPKNTNPSSTDVNWDHLIEANPSPMAKQFVKSSHTVYQRLLYGGIPYPSNKINNRWENGYNTSSDKFVYMRKYGVDCTRLLRYLFVNMLDLPYNSKEKNAPIVSNTFTLQNNQSQLKNFIQIPKTKNGFKPQTGDILAFPGHTIAVLDPKNCIAIQSSIWLCKEMKNGFCVDSDYGKSAGVSIYHLASERFCKNGVWKGMDSDKLKFTIGWRHKAFDTWITKMPSQAESKSRIILKGKNLAGKYIYFPGSKTPVKATLWKKRKKNQFKNDANQIVSLIVPHDAKSGKLKIYWGTGNPSLEKTVESLDKINIYSNHKTIVSIYKESYLD